MKLCYWYNLFGSHRHRHSSRCNLIGTPLYVYVCRGAPWCDAATHNYIACLASRGVPSPVGVQASSNARFRLIAPACDDCLRRQRIVHRSPPLARMQRCFCRQRAGGITQFARVYNTDFAVSTTVEAFCELIANLLSQQRSIRVLHPLRWLLNVCSCIFVLAHRTCHRPNSS